METSKTKDCTNDEEKSPETKQDEDDIPSTSKGENKSNICEDDDLANVATAEEYLIRKKINFLEYEKQMFLDMINSDGLVVCAK